MFDRKRRSRRGAYAVEFALVLPIYAIILAGTIDFGWWMHLQGSMVECAREGARQGSLIDQGANPDVTAALAATSAWTNTELPDQVEFTALISGAAACPDETVTVTGTLTYTPFFGTLPIPVETVYTATMRLMKQAC